MITSDDSGQSSNQQWKGWEKVLTENIVGTINDLRIASNLTIADLRERLNFYGWPVSQSTLTGILSGGKRSSIAFSEVLLFARAFRVSPLALILGLPGGKELPKLENWEQIKSPLDLVAWLTGSKAFLPEYPGDQKRVEWTSTVMAVELDNLLSVQAVLDATMFQNAVQIVVKDFDKELLLDALSSRIVEGVSLRNAIENLTQLYSTDLQLAQIMRKSLPEALLRALEKNQSEGSDVNLPIYGINTEAELSRARLFIEDTLKNAPTVRGINGSSTS